MATSDLILDKTSAERGIEPAEGEVHQEVARLARQLDKEPDALRQEMEAEGTLEGLRAEMRRKLVLDTLLSELSVEEKVVDRKEVEEISSE
jgi:FKBP-type peptidyl-prolyl cis-trans isomerase (trigger factor)